MTQGDLFTIHAPVEDIPRLSTQLERVESFMNDRQWHSLRQIAAATGCLETAASARLRDLRKGGYTVDRRKDERVRGLWWYRAFKSAPTGI